MTATANPVSVRNIAHSISPNGIPLLTQQLRYPRMIHSEFLTHRVFSRNGRSSRAVPSATMLKEAADPYVPPFRLNQRGMTPGEEMSPSDLASAETIWRDMANACIRGVEALIAMKVHKQWANRPLEWFGYIDVLVTSTCWLNFDVLRMDAGAQHEIRLLATMMHEARRLSVPRLLEVGEWHLPYVPDYEVGIHGGLTDPTGILRKLSTARCARLSIRPFDGNDRLEAELARYDMLMVSRPVHASPAEHQATPDVYAPSWIRGYVHAWEHPHEHGNFVGWRQNRRMIPYESVMEDYALEGRRA